MGILDTILSAGGGILGGMVGGPLGAAIGSGLGTYLGGGNTQQALMSGMLGYGLGGLGEGVAGLGAKQMAGEELAKQAALQAELEGTVLPASYAEMAAATTTPEQIAAAKAGSSKFDLVTKGLGAFTPDTVMPFAKDNLKYLGATGLGLAGMAAQQQPQLQPLSPTQQGQMRPYRYTPYNQMTGASPYYTPLYANGGPVQNVPYPAGGINYPQAHMQDKTDFYAQSTATPTPTAVVGAAPQTDYDARINPQGDVMRAAGGGSVSRRRYVGEDTGEGPYGMPSTELDAIKKIIDASNKAAQSNYAQGGIASLGEYAAGGKLLQGPGDGMSDSIPAVIKGAKPQRAALAQGEFVVPADVVSHLGNGATDAGAKRLYAMMDRVRQARTGTKKQGRQINPEKFMPA